MKNLQQLEIHVKAIQEILLAQDPERSVYLIVGYKL